MSAEERIERQHIHVVDSYVFSNHPIHFAGMAMTRWRGMLRKVNACRRKE